MFLVVLRRSGPKWRPGRPLEQQSNWSAHAAFMDGHLRIDTIDRWTIRLDGRGLRR
jgi:hypothetical protein